MALFHPVFRSNHIITLKHTQSTLIEVEAMFLEKEHCNPFQFSSKETIEERGISEILSLFYVESQLALVPDVFNCSYGLWLEGTLWHEKIYENIWSPGTNISYWIQSVHRPSLCLFTWYFNVLLE